MKKYIALITGLLPFIVSAQLVMKGNYYVVLHGGSLSSPTTLVLTNPAPTGITNNGTGWIISENEYNQVDWNIAGNTGNYIIPFGYGTTDYLPVTFNIMAAGVGNGSIKFATYHGPTFDNLLYMPSDVANMTDFNLLNYSIGAADRFWIIDAGSGYTTKPTSDITFTYIRNGASSEIALPNYIVEDSLVAQRYNSSLNEWYDWTGAKHTDATSGSTGTVSTGAISPSGVYRSWSLFSDSSLLNTGIPSMNGVISTEVYPNPTEGNFTIKGVVGGQEIKVYNSIGQLLKSTLVNNSTTMNVDISAMANGVYLVRILNKDGGLAAQRKIVKTQ